MRFRILVGALVLVALSAGVVATNGAGVAPVRQWAIVQLQRPTLIAGRFAMGSVMFVHDDAKMKAGLPCTEVYRFEPGKGPTELLSAFHCTPRNRDVSGTFKMLAQTAADGTARLNEYQFAGDAEGHGVPFAQDPQAQTSAANACCKDMQAQKSEPQACCKDMDGGGCCDGRRAGR
jgi:hypothetical protein